MYLFIHTNRDIHAYTYTHLPLVQKNTHALVLLQMLVHTQVQLNMNLSLHIPAVQANFLWNFSLTLTKILVWMELLLISGWWYFNFRQEIEWFNSNFRQKIRWLSYIRFLFTFFSPEIRVMSVLILGRKWVVYSDIGRNRLSFLQSGRKWCGFIQISGRK